MNDETKGVGEKELKERVKWLIRLRWFAGIGVFMVITLSKYLIVSELPWILLYTGNMVLLIYNGLLHLYHNHVEFKRGGLVHFKRAYRFAIIQISIDWLFLSYFIHFSGGIENHFIFFFVFHMVITSMLLTRRGAYLQAALGISYIAIICFGEYFRLIPHYHLRGFFPEGFIFSTPWYTVGVFFVFLSTMILTCYMAVSVVYRLRQGEQACMIANEKLEAQDKVKSQYVLTVSHDLQASLSTIQSCLQVVLVELTGPIPEKAREMIARAEARSRFLLHFVKDLLNLSRIRAMNQLKRNTVPLNQLVEKITDQVNDEAKEKKLELRKELSDQFNVYVDPDTMEQVFLNLFKNAIRYTPQNGRVMIRSQKLKNKKFIQVSVSDTGIGISQEDIPHIFDDFYRAENAMIMEKSGTGLGLAIVKKIVEAHGGRIWVESRIGKGSIFIFTIPLVN